MTQLIPMQVDENTIIYIEITETNSPHISKPLTSATEEEQLQGKSLSQTVSNLRQRFSSQNQTTETIVNSFNAIENTIRAYTNYTLNAFKKGVSANVDKVTLEFGITLGGEMGVPYVTKGTAESSLKITVECSFPEQKENQSL